MKALRFFAFIIYSFYNRGKSRDIAYFSTLCAIVLLIFLHLLQAIILFDIPGEMIWGKGDNRALNYLKGIGASIPVLILLALFVKEKDLKYASYDESKVKKGKIYFVIYLFSSFAFLIYLLTTITPK